MNEYVLLTDSSSDLPAALAAEMEVGVLPLTVYVEDKKYTNYLDEREIAFKDFYDLLRTKVPAKTSAVNVGDFEEFMEPVLKEGKDILYLGFSSGLSGTFNASVIAAQELSEKYPERKIYCVDTLCASLGQGLLVYHAWQQKKNGKSIEEVRDYVENNKLNLCHWFTIDDLMFLKRGGRVSASTAILGSMLNIKPVLHVDNDGKLISVDKARGRKASLRALVDRAEKLGINLKDQTIFISHGDCEEEAKYLGDMMKERFGVKEVLINYVGPVIGAHAGPGVVALFFLGTER